MPAPKLRRIGEKQAGKQWTHDLIAQGKSATEIAVLSATDMKSPFRKWNPAHRRYEGITSQGVTTYIRSYLEIDPPIGPWPLRKEWVMRTPHGVAIYNAWNVPIGFGHIPGDPSGALWLDTPIEIPPGEWRIIPLSADFWKKSRAA